MGERRGTKALELWCRRLTEGYPGVKIDNMTTSWRNGLAFCAMIHHFRPELIDFEKLNKDDIYHNNDLAFRTAEHHLGIPALLDAADMASYEVPDRLSILTYLSQFYQVFASQDSSNRLKRTTPTVNEKGAISKPSGPPTKMAHVVGVPKREPCEKCSMPVFLAERLTIGKNVYHRTCLKCARCTSQLTPGSFYETEIDGEFCCETCPDEERSVPPSSLVAAAGPSSIVVTTGKHRHDFLKTENSGTAATSRSSIADRLAFFENDGRKLLQKSLSDEEKSKSLKKINDAQKYSYKNNSALSSFMSSHLMPSDDDCIDAATAGATGAVDADVKSNENSRKTSISSGNSLSMSSTNDDDEAPALPKTLPPTEFTEMDDTYSKIAKPSLEISYSVKPTDSVDLDHSTNKTTNPIEGERIFEKNSSTLAFSQDTQREGEHFFEINTKNIEQSENNIFMMPKKNGTRTKATRTETTNDNLNDSIKVTKDNPEIDVMMRTQNNDVIDSFHKTSEDQSSSESENRNTNTSMVRVRLNQFENITDNDNSTSSSMQISNCNDNDSLNHTEKVESFKDVRTSINALENEVPKICVEEECCRSDAENLNVIISDEKRIENASYPKSEIDKKNDRKSEENVKNDEIISTIEKTVESTIEVNDTDEESKLIGLGNAPRTVDDISKCEEYPEDLNPFKSDEENEETKQLSLKEKRKSLNPFDSSDDDDNTENPNKEYKIKPPRPPPPMKISKNPFGSESEEDNLTTTAIQSSRSTSTPKRTPIPTPRHNVSNSQATTPEPTPRLTRQTYASPLKTSDYYGSSISLASSNATPNRPSSEYFTRDGDGRGSTNSIASSSESASGVKPRKARKAPAPPPPQFIATHKIDESSIDRKVSPSKSATLSGKKKRPAPAPPPSSTSSQLARETIDDGNDEKFFAISTDITKTSHKDEETAEVSQLEQQAEIGKESASITTIISPPKINIENQSNLKPDDEKIEEINSSDETPKRRIISVDKSLMEDSPLEEGHHQSIEAENVVFRRTVPFNLEAETNDEYSEVGESHDRQLEKLKDNKEAKNRNRQSQVSITPAIGCEESGDLLLYNKAVHGKWKRRKGPAPALPIPPKKVLQMLPLQEIRHELEIIEVQQQGLEKQGVILEKMIRERCEGQDGIVEDVIENNKIPIPIVNSKEVEDLILQLFELVNEKNELFRRQAELMYLRRQHRLEQEQADLEYEIRVLMAQPERNKTDSDKAREESLIGRLVEVVQLRNEVIDCLEMDRLRETEEDQSIKQRLEMHTAQRDAELIHQASTKLSKKEKKKQKETKKLGKSKKLDADKDADESEINTEKQKIKKKKKKFLF